MLLLRQEMTHPRYSLPVDLLDHHGADEVPLIIQNLVKQFGQLLYWWPTIVEKARDLRVTGVLRTGKPMTL
jgi:hypothetical protein